MSSVFEGTLCRGASVAQLGCAS